MVPLSDLRHTMRLWSRNAGHMLLALATLAFGIAAITVVFSVVRAVLLRPLPLPSAEGLVMVWERNLPRARDRNVVSPGNFIHWEEQNEVFSSLGAFSPRDAALTGVGEPREIDVHYVSAGFFPALGVPAAHGRTLAAEDDRPGSGVAVISHRLWRDVLQSDPNVVGHTLVLDARPRTIVGVMPEGFTFLDSPIDAWLPLGLPPQARQPRGRWLLVVGRLKPGVTIERAQANMDAIAGRMTRAFPDFNTGWAINVVPLREQMVGNVRTPLLVLFAAVSFVLLIVCVNVAGLLLAQASARQRELAVRTALGASRARLVRQLLMESGLLAVAGGAAGIGLAWAALRGLAALPTGRIPIPRLAEVSLDWPIVGFAAAVAVMTGLVFGTAPALGASAIELHGTLKDGARGTGAPRGAALRALLVTVEVALAIVLLAGTGLLVRSFVRLTSVPLGLDPTGVSTVPVGLPSARYADEHERLAFFREVLSDVAAIPGVEAAGAITFLPMRGLGAATSFVALDRPTPPLGQEPVTDVRVIAGDYFRALGIPLLRGRTFTGREEGAAAQVVVVNETFARETWPGEDPIGRRIRVSWTPEDAEEVVIGVVGDVRAHGALTPVRPMIYWPPARSPSGFMYFVVRAAGRPDAVARPLVAAIRARDRDLPIPAVEPMEAVIAASVRERRLTMLALGAFAGAALLLAAVGIYGVVSFNVGRRTREIGVRMALGAQRGDVLRMILRQTIALAAAGVIAGTAAAWLLTRLMRTLLFEIEPGDPLTLSLVALILAAIALAAGYVPGRRAARVEPLEALRYE